MVAPGASGFESVMSSLDSLSITVVGDRLLFRPPHWVSFSNGCCSSCSPNTCTSPRPGTPVSVSGEELSTCRTACWPPPLSSSRLTVVTSMTRKRRRETGEPVLFVTERRRRSVPSGLHEAPGDRAGRRVGGAAGARRRRGQGEGDRGVMVYGAGGVLRAGRAEHRRRVVADRLGRVGRDQDEVRRVVVRVLHAAGQRLAAHVGVLLGAVARVRQRRAFGQGGAGGARTVV